MSPQIVDDSTFADVISEMGWADIDQFFAACIARGVFGKEFFDSAIEKAAKQEIRRRLRKGVIKDRDGRRIKVASILLSTKEGRVRRVYKQETMFDVGDCVQVISYWKQKRDKCNNRVRYYRDLSIQLHGPQVQGMLPLDPDDPAL